MGALALLLNLLGFCLGIGSLVCFILVLVKMFQNDQTVMGIVCIVTFFCCIGGLIAFVVGWMNSSTWRIEQIMMIWTGCFIGSILVNILYFALFGAAQMQGQGFGPL
ncbi:MAG: hypothetical protein U9N87_04830 [Planctomycetota bacterium]|nr:hypothetical protein [Planctomycetota bacterium]